MFVHDYLLGCEISTVRTLTLIYKNRKYASKPSIRKEEAKPEHRNELTSSSRIFKIPSWKKTV